MLCTVRHLQGTSIEAVDGAIGAVDALLFDDVNWVIRYLVVNTGKWLSGRRVLLSPISVASLEPREHVRVRLDKEQIRTSPDIDSDRPVSRQMEAAFHAHYGYAPYWGGISIWGSGLYPAALAAPVGSFDASNERRAPHTRVGETTPHGDPHLRSTREVMGYHIAASDGEVGHIDDFLVDDDSWAIWRLVVDTSNWPGGRWVLLSPARVRAIDWTSSRIYVDITVDRIRRSPEFREDLGRRQPTSATAAEREQ